MSQGYTQEQAEREYARRQKENANQHHKNNYQNNEERSQVSYDEMRNKNNSNVGDGDELEIMIENLMQKGYTYEQAERNATSQLKKVAQQYQNNNNNNSINNNNNNNTASNNSFYSNNSSSYNINSQFDDDGFADADDGEAEIMVRVSCFIIGPLLQKGGKS